MTEEIIFNGDLMAIVVRSTFSKEGISFFTSDQSSQQLAFMKHQEGKIILPHIHNTIRREIFDTNEVLILRKGKLRVDFYDTDNNYIESRVLCQNDLLILFKGGHGFEVLEDLEMFEVKQGPYLGEQDKVKFEYKKDMKIIIK